MGFHTVWIALLILLLICFLLLGVWICRLPLGILIDSRGKMSLSRLQIVLWSWIIISAFFAVAITAWTMNIDVPEQIWALMGISVGTTAGAVIVQGGKTNQEPADSIPTEQKNVSRQGILKTNESTREASLKELFCGEELGDHQSVDISKVQMFFFSIAMVLGYAGVLWSTSWPASGPAEFPELSTSLVALLGISQAGYLTVKAAPKTKTQS